MDVSDELIDLAGLRAAVSADLDGAPPLLPPNPVAPALDGRRDDVAAWAHGQLTGPYYPPREEIVAVSKPRHGVRPVAIWDLPTRLLYSTLVARLSTYLPTPPRGRRVWRRFQWTPLRERGRYIISADIASCYNYIDHQLLAEELLLQTGDHETVTGVISLVAEVSRRHYGLPQQSAASDVLAEAFLGRMERALFRRGLAVNRFNDDLRLNCDSWSAVVKSIEVLSEELRKLGLILNDGKTYTWTRKTYEAHLREADKLRNEIAEDAELDLTELEEGDYAGTIIEREPDPDDVGLLTSIRVLERWQSIAGRGRVTDKRLAEHRAVVQLVPLALSDLAAHPSENRAVGHRYAHAAL